MKNIYMYISVRTNLLLYQLVYIMELYNISSENNSFFNEVKGDIVLF